MEEKVENNACCAHLVVAYQPVGNEDGSFCDRWICRECKSEFTPVYWIEKLRTNLEVLKRNNEALLQGVMEGLKYTYEGIVTKVLLDALAKTETIPKNNYR